MAAVLLITCLAALLTSSNPIYKHAPEEYFPASPALDVAKAIRRDDVAALDKLFAQHPELDPNLEGQKGVTFLFWAYAHHHVKSMKKAPSPT